MAFGFASPGGYGAGPSVIPTDTAHPDVVSISDAELLFTGHFERKGPDLILTGHDGRHHLIPGYFAAEHPAALVAPNGARITGDLVELLAGSQAPGQYAQTTAPAPINAIGRIEKVVGDVTAMRNGVAVALHVGDAVYKSDVVQTGADSSCGIGFPDGTALNLVSNTRMALNDYVYDPNGSSNDALFSLVQGGFAFVAGKVAHTGDMKITTPVATMGIRGTTGYALEQVAAVNANLGNVTMSFAVVADPGTDRVGQYDLIDQFGNVVAVVGRAGVWTNVSFQGANLPPSVSTQLMTAANFGIEQQLVPALVQILNSLGNLTPTPQSAPSPGSSTPPIFELINLPQTFQPNSNTQFAISVTANGPNGTTTTAGTVTISSNPFAAQLTPTVVNWIAQTNGTWENPANWSGNGVPTAPDTVNITLPIKVTIEAAESANSLFIGTGAILNIASGGTLELSQGVANFGTVQLNSSGADPTLAINGTVFLLDGGTIALKGPTAENLIVGVSGTGATLVNVDNTIIGSGTIGRADGALTLINGANGTIEAEPLAGDSGRLVLNTGNGVTNSGLFAAASGGTLHVADNVSNFGLIEAMAAGEVVATGSLDNNNTIEATGAGARVSLTGDLINESGATVTALSGGTILFADTVTNIGTIGASGADAIIGLERANISGGTLETDTGGVIKTLAGANAFVNVTIAGGSFLDSRANTVLRLQGSTVLDGTATFEGDGTFKLASTGAGIAGAAGDAVELVNDGTIAGAGHLGGGDRRFVLVNKQSGVIDASGPRALIIDNHSPGSASTQPANAVINTGLIEATGRGGLTIDNTTISNSFGAGHDTGQIEVFARSHITLDNATVLQGFVSIASGGEIRTADGTSNTIDTVDRLHNLSTVTLSNAGKLLVGDNSSLTLASSDAIDNSGTIKLDSTGHVTRLVFDQADAGLDGGGQVVLSDNSKNVIAVAHSGDQLTNFDNTISGSGTIGTGGMVLVNDGVINADHHDAALTLDPTSLTNTGTLEATNGATLAFDSVTVANAGGTISVARSAAIDLNSATIADGTVSIAGRLDAAGTSAITNATLDNSGTIDSTSGTFTLSLATLTNGGKLKADGGTFNLSADSFTNNLGAKVIGKGGGDFTLSDTNSTNDGVYTAKANSSITLDGAATVDVGAKIQAIGRGSAVTVNNNLTNDGSIFAFDHGTVSIDGSGLTNTGGIGVIGHGSTLNVTADVIGSGTVAIINGGRADFKGAFNEDVTFSGAGTLALAHSKHYRGTVSGFANGDKLDLTNLQYSPAEYAVWRDNVLTIYNGATPEESIRMSGDYAANNFALVNDGAGGTEVVYRTVDEWARFSAHGNLQSGRWGNGSNWSQGVVPTSATKAAIDGSNAYSVTVTRSINSISPAIVKSVAIGDAHATLDGAGTLTATKSLYNAGTIQPGGDHQKFTLTTDRLFNASTGIIQANGAHTLTINELGNGNANFGTIGAFAGALLTISHGGTATNERGGIIEAIGNDSALTLHNNEGEANYGLIRAANGGTLTIAVAPTDNNGAGGNYHTMEAVSGGTLSIAGDMLNRGAATIKAGADSTVVFSPDQQFSHDDLVVNRGLIVAKNGGELDVQDHNIRNVGAGAHGIIIDSGSELLVDTATLKLTGGGDVALASDSVLTEAHTGTILHLDNVDNTIAGAGTIGSGDSWLALTNESGGTINANVGGQTLTIHTGNTVINDGTLEATGGGTLDILDSKIHNAGIGADGIVVDGSASTLLVDAATLKLTGDGDVTLQNGGLITESASYVLAHSGAILALDNIDNTIEGAGTIGTGDGHFALANRADATIDANVSGEMLTLDTGNTIINRGILEATGGGTLDVQDGKIHNAGAGTDGIIVGSGSALLVDTHQLKLTGGGDVTLQNGSLLTENANNPTVAHSGAVLHLDNIDNTIQGAGTIGTGDGHFALANESAGTIDANVSGQTLTIGTGKPTINNGTMEASNGGTLDVAAAVAGAGSVTISGSGTADFHHGFNQNVAFSGAGTLELAHSYGGTIGGFGAGDTVDLTAIGYSSGEYDVWTQTSTLNGGSGTLAVYSGDGTIEETLHLNGVYTQNEFALASDGSTTHGGSGGTDLNFNYVSFLTGQTNNNGNVTPQIGNAGSTLEPTDGNYDEASSWFSNSKYSIGNFTASFDYQAIANPGSPLGPADGTAFILQNSAAGNTALGGPGGGLGYSGISPSAAVEFNIYDGHTQGTNFATNGSTEVYHSTNPIDFWDTGDTIQVALSYDGSTLTETLTDLVNGNTYSTSYNNVDLSQILGSDSAYVGFSAATGSGAAAQTVSDFNFQFDSAAHWTGAPGADWTTANDWTDGNSNVVTTPNATNAVFIDESGSYTLEISSVDTAGSLTITSAGAGADVQDESGGSLSVTGALTIDAGSFSLIGGSLSASSIYVGSAGYFIGEGTVQAPLDNDGGIVEAYGNLSLLGTVTGTGNFQIDAGNTLEFGGSVAGGTVTFGGSSGTLKIDAPASFGGEISMAHSDSAEVLDLGGLNSQTGDTFATATSLNSGVTTLTVTDETQSTSESVQLVGDFTTSTWNVTADGSGGANVSDPPAQAAASPSVSVSGRGNDTFVFHPGMGAETAANFNPKTDTIELDNFTNIETVHQLASLITTDAQGDAVIALGHHDSITLPGTTASYLQGHLHSLVHLS